MRVYLVHLDAPLAHARHYLGVAEDGDVERRLAEHRAGRGSPFLAAAERAGIRMHVARTWEGGRQLERRLKRQKNSWRFCPVCRPERDGIRREGRSRGHHG